jgi:hypothetical protein
LTVMPIVVRTIIFAGLMRNTAAEALCNIAFLRRANWAADQRVVAKDVAAKYHRSTHNCIWPTGYSRFPSFAAR